MPNPNDRKWVYHKGDVEVKTDKSKPPLWTKEQAARWIAEIKELLKPSTAPHMWLDEDAPRMTSARVLTGIENRV